MSASELALVITPLATVAVAYVGRARLQAVETRVDGHLDGLNARILHLEKALTEARLAPAEDSPLD